MKLDFKHKCNPFYCKRKNYEIFLLNFLQNVILLVLVLGCFTRNRKSQTNLWRITYHQIAITVWEGGSLQPFYNKYLLMLPSVQHPKIFKLISLRGLDTYILFHLMLVVLWEICGQNCNELVLVVSVPGETQFLESLPSASQSTSTSTYSVLG